MGIDGVLICGPAKENVANNGEWEANSVEERRYGLENDDSRVEESNDEEAKGTFEEAGGVNETRRSGLHIWSLIVPRASHSDGGPSGSRNRGIGVRRCCRDCFG